MKHLFQVPGSRFQVRVRGSRNQACTAGALGMVLALVPAVASPQGLTDPTRPPDAIGAGFDPGAGDVSGGMTLQSVIISPAGNMAIISGVVVKLGEKYGDAVLVKVAESEVVLKSGDVSQVLKMHPGVEKRESAQAAPKDAARRGKAQSKAARAADGGASPR